MTVRVRPQVGCRATGSFDFAVWLHITANVTVTVNARANFAVFWQLLCYDSAWRSFKGNEWLKGTIWGGVD